MGGFSSPCTDRLLEFIKTELQKAHTIFSETAESDDLHDVVTLFNVLQDAELRIYGSVKTKEFEGMGENERI